jgi:hypothetical protein
MTTKSLRPIAAGLAGIACVAAAVAASAQTVKPEERFQPFKTVWAGVYSADQADRGKQTAAQLCGRCHGADLKGGQAAHGLTGRIFFDRWNNLRLLDVTAYIQAAMPHEHEFVIPADSTRDIVGFMLRESGVPAGREPMPKDVNVLGDILIVRPPAR